MIDYSELRQGYCDECDKNKNELYDLWFYSFNHYITICKDCMEQLIKEYERLIK
jgi:Fe-S oxidoreductase